MRFGFFAALAGDQAGKRRRAADRAVGRAVPLRLQQRAVEVGGLEQREPRVEDVGEHARPLADSEARTLGPRGRAAQRRSGGSAPIAVALASVRSTVPPGLTAMPLPFSSFGRTSAAEPGDAFSSHAA